MAEIHADASVWTYSVDYLDNELGETIISSEVLEELEKELESEQKNLENQLLMLRSQNAKGIEKKNAKIKEIVGNASSVIRDIDGFVDSASHQVSITEEEITELSELLNNVRGLEKCSSYLDYLAQLEEISSFVQSAMLVGNVDQAINRFALLVALAEDTKDSRCTNLCNYIISTIAYWHKILVSSLAGAMEQTLQAYGWPFIVTSDKRVPPVNSAQLKEDFPILVKQMMSIQLPEFLLEKVEMTFDCGRRHNISLPMQFFLIPFKKRFSYHFCENRKTNNIEKPEWYFTQVNLWLNDHKKFLFENVQTIFAEAGCPQVNVLQEFVEGLMLLVADKLRTDLTRVLSGNHPNTDQLVAHHIDEVLAFHTEISSSFSNPDAFPRCLNVLVEKDIFNKWISVEKEYALRKMNEMFFRKDAWLVQTPMTIGDDDDDDDDAVGWRLPQFAELFLMLMVTIQDRYAFLTSVNCQLKFCQLQLDLIDDFRIRLFQIRKQITMETNQVVENAKYIGILNVVAFVVDFLRKWADDPFYVKLSYYKRKMKADEHEEDGMNMRRGYSEDGHCAGGGDDIDSDFLPSARNNHGVCSLDPTPQSDEPSLFDGMIDLFERMRTEMMDAACQCIFSDFKHNSKSYIRDKWLALPSHKEFLTLTLSNSACSMLKSLQGHLHEMESSFNTTLFRHLWQKLTQMIDSYIFESVICANRFNEGGAMQLNFDMTRNLFPLFSHYTNKPENFFKNIKEACIILTLASGSAMLIRDVLRRALHPSDARVEVSDPIAALHDLNVHMLAPEQVWLLLSLRMDLQNCPM